MERLPPLDPSVTEYEKIQTEYASFKPTADAARKLKEVSTSLTPHRPPTQPASDIEKERKTILEGLSKNLHVIQLALGVLLLTLIEYLVLPAQYAHGVAFLTLCVGTAVGIYLATI
jgi:hypothetical protein